MLSRYDYEVGDKVYIIRSYVDHMEITPQIIGYLGEETFIVKDYDCHSECEYSYDECYDSLDTAKRLIMKHFENKDDVKVEFEDVQLFNEIICKVKITKILSV